MSDSIRAALRAAETDLANLDAKRAPLVNLVGTLRNYLGLGEPQAARKAKAARLVKPAKRVKAAKPAEPKSTPIAAAPPSTGGSVADGRRERLLAVIVKAGEMGATAGDIRQRSTDMSDQDRWYALNVLKQKGKIRRVGNAWVAGA